MVRYSVSPAPQCISDVKFHEATWSVRKDGYRLRLRYSFGVGVVQSQILSAPVISVVSLGAGGLRFIPGLLHQVHLEETKRAVGVT